MDPEDQGNVNSMCFGSSMCNPLSLVSISWSGHKAHKEPRSTQRIRKPENPLCPLCKHCGLCDLFPGQVTNTKPTKNHEEPSRTLRYLAFFAIPASSNEVSSDGLVSNKLSS